MFLELTDAEQTFLVAALDDTADAFGDDEGEDFDLLAELIEAEASLRRSQLAMIDEALISYRDRHLTDFGAAENELFEAIADKLGAALGD